MISKVLVTYVCQLGDKHFASSLEIHSSDGRPADIVAIDLDCDTPDEALAIALDIARDIEAAGSWGDIAAQTA